MRASASGRNTVFTSVFGVLRPLLRDSRLFHPDLTVDKDTRKSVHKLISLLAFRKFKILFTGTKDPRAEKETGGPSSRRTLVVGWVSFLERPKEPHGFTEFIALYMRIGHAQRRRHIACYTTKIPRMHHKGKRGVGIERIHSRKNGRFHRTKDEPDAHGRRGELHHKMCFLYFCPSPHEDPPFFLKKNNNSKIFYIVQCHGPCFNAPPHKYHVVGFKKTT